MHFKRELTEKFISVLDTTLPWLSKDALSDASWIRSFSENVLQLQCIILQMSATELRTAD